MKYSIKFSLRTWKRKTNFVVCNYVCRDNGKITRKKMSKLFSYDGLVKCRRNLNFEKGDTVSYTRENDGVCWGMFKEYLKQIFFTAVLRKANAHSVAICRLIKKINNVNKNRSKRKNWFKLCLWGFSKKESYVVHISFYTTRGWNSR